MKITEVECTMMRLPLGEVGQPWRDAFPNGVNALLVGEALVTAPDIAAKMRELIL